MSKGAKDLKRHFPTEIHKGPKSIRRCTPSPVVRQMQIKFTRRYNLTIIRMATVKTETNKHWWGHREIGTLAHCEHKWYSCFGKRVRWVLKKLNTELPYDPAISFLGGRSENRDLNGCLYINVHSSIIHNAHKLQTMQMSINQWINKVYSIYTRPDQNIVSDASTARYMDEP